MTASKNKIVLITGASGGIGYELALICAKNNIDLVLSARSEDKLASVKKELEEKYAVTVHLFPADLSVAGKTKELYHYCHQHRIAINYLINNAGYGDYKPVADADPDVLSNLLNLNVIALTELSALFAKDMIKRGTGRILNVASTAAYQPVPRLAVYSASKSYVVSFTEALHAELKNTGVTATVLSPGATSTGFMDRAEMQKSAIAQGAKSNAAEVAQAGYDAMMSGKLYVIPGLLNKLLAFTSKIMPSRRAVLAISALFSKEK